MADQWEESKETIKEKLKLLGENYLKQLLERLNEIEACYKALLRESGISCADYDMLIEIVRLLSATQSPTRTLALVKSLVVLVCR